MFCEYFHSVAKRSQAFEAKLLKHPLRVLSIRMRRGGAESFQNNIVCAFDQHFNLIVVSYNNARPFPFARKFKKLKHFDFSLLSIDAYYFSSVGVLYKSVALLLGCLYKSDLVGTRAHVLVIVLTDFLS